MLTGSLTAAPGISRCSGFQWTTAGDSAGGPAPKDHCEGGIALPSGIELHFLRICLKIFHFCFFCFCCFLCIFSLTCFECFDEIRCYQDKPRLIPSQGSQIRQEGRHAGPGGDIDQIVESVVKKRPDLSIQTTSVLAGEAAF